jgi:hypothetical protein
MSYWGLKYSKNGLDFELQERNPARAVLEQPLLMRLSDLRPVFGKAFSREFEQRHDLTGRGDL